MTNGVLLALAAYLSFSLSDAVIKGLGAQLGTFEIAFWMMLFAAPFLYFTRQPGERWRDFWRSARPVAVNARGVSAVAGSILSVYAFTTIPFAETYALIFLAPLIVTILSIVLLKEHVGPWRWFAIVAGFAGVLLVVQPGFRELGLGHLAALGVACLAATTVLLLRSLTQTEKRTTLMGYFLAYGVGINGVLTLATAEHLPSLPQLGWLALAGAFTAGGQFCLLVATRVAPANQIAPTHYSQIVWAVLLGALFFSEFPDALALAGLAVVGGAGLLTAVRERIRLGATRWNPFGRNRL